MNVLKKSDIYNYRNITSYNISYYVTKLDYCCFNDCCELRSITIPNSVRSLGGRCFSFCYKLSSITIPNSVTSLGCECFCDCSNLRSITLGSSISYLGKECFCHCSNLYSIGIPSSVSSLSDGCFASCSGLYSFTIPNSVTSLGNACFHHCSNLSSITIPDSVSYINNRCFARCSNLRTITIPDLVPRLGYQCFYDCPNLSSITIPDSVSSLGDSCFQECFSLSSITIPNSVSILGKECFKDCSNLNSITFGNSVTSLGSGCFEGCSSLSSITIPDSVSSLGDSCFRGCSNLKTIYTNNLKIKPGSDDIPSECKILPYKQSPDVKPTQNVIEQIQIEPLQITEEHSPNLLNYNKYIKERSELLETYQNKSVVKYHESIIDIAEDFNENIKVKQLELDEYIKVLQNYKNNLLEISSNLTKKIDQHSQQLKEIEENNYKLPEKNIIKDTLNKIVLTVEDEKFNQTIVLNNDYHYKEDLIIPKTNNPYTEIYKLPCRFTEITPENKRDLVRAEKKIALLSIEYNNEYIDLSNTDIQYFIDTFKNCPNLKEIIYPDTVEYK